MKHHNMVFNILYNFFIPTSITSNFLPDKLEVTFFWFSISYSFYLPKVLLLTQ